MWQKQEEEVKRVNTAGSIWLFDESGRYLRMPKTEGPRYEWDIQRQRESTWLLDNRWMEYDEVRVIIRFDRPCLQIRYPGSVVGIITTALEEDSLVTARELMDTDTDRNE